jgi:hypothetical protein
MAINYETKVYPGGLRNRINRITMRTGGRSVATYNDGHTDQGYDTRSVIGRTTAEPPVERTLQDGTKNYEV